MIMLVSHRVAQSRATLLTGSVTELELALSVLRSRFTCSVQKEQVTVHGADAYTVQAILIRAGISSQRSN